MLDPDAVAARSFGSSFRGYDPEEVRRFLVEVSADLRALAAGALEGIDEDRATVLLGEEAGRLIAQARASAAAIEAKAEGRAAEVLREAQEAAVQARATVDTERERAYAEGALRAEEVLADAERSREELLAEARAEAHLLVAEAEAARERVLRDLARRRKAVRAQVEQLHAARDELLKALTEVGRIADEARGRMVVALPEAKLAAAAAARRAEAEDEVSVEQLESELEAFRLAGLALVPPDDDAVDEEEPEAETEALPEPRQPVRVFRASRGVVEAELYQVDEAAEFEQVRVIPVADDEHVAADEVEVVAADGASEAEPVEPESESESEPESESESESEPVEVEAEPVEPEIEVESEPVEPEPVEPEPVEPEPVEPEPVGIESEPEAEPVAEAPEPVESESESIEPEIEPESEPEVDAEPVGVESEPEAEPVAERPSTEAVDALFARLRAGREARTAAAEAVLADRDPEPPAEDDETEHEPFVVDDVEVHVGGGGERAVLLARRDELLAAPTAALTRHLKRLLADEQNTVLDGVRRLGATVEAVAPPADLAARWAGAAVAELAEAAAAGARFVGQPGAASPDVDDIAAELGHSTAAVLAERLVDAVRRADGDVDLAGDAVRSVCREWRARRLTDAIDLAVHAAFGRGAVSAVAGTGTALCWIVDDGGSPCPDAEDNALAGPVVAGGPFPTGHLQPPAHPGCRCVLAVAAVAVAR